MVGAFECVPADENPVEQPGNNELCPIGQGCRLEAPNGPSENQVFVCEDCSVTFVNVSVNPEDGEPFGFDLNFATCPIALVAVKTGPAFFEYEFDPPAFCITGLGSPGEMGISHLDVCYVTLSPTESPTRMPSPSPVTGNPVI